MDRNNGSVKNGLAFQTSLETNGFKKIEIAFFLYHTGPLKKPKRTARHQN